MKVVSVNAWAGSVYEPLMKFVVDQAESTEVFCFQEMTFCRDAQTPDLQVDDEEYGRIRTDLFGDIATALTDFTGLAYPALEGSRFEGGELPEGMQVGQAMFIRNNLTLREHGGLRCFDSDSRTAIEKVVSITGNCQWLQLPNLLVMNLHGLWQKEGKGDTPDRLRQSEILTDFMRQRGGPQLVVGDFNMLPDTESLAALAVGKQNLIRTYNVPTTRSELYTKAIPYSDYALCSDGLAIDDFQVPNIVISDHLPLLLKISGSD